MSINLHCTYYIFSAKQNEYDFDLIIRWNFLELMSNISLSKVEKKEKRFAICYFHRI